MLFGGPVFLIVFLGNPVSAAFATSKIRAYAEETYPSKDFEVAKAVYNFKFSDYYSEVQSKSSKDTCFHVTWSNGKINDDYKYEVENHFTTYRRLQTEFSKAVEDIILKEFPYKTSILFADLGKGDNDLSKLALEMPLDIKNPPIPAYLTIYFC